MLSKSYETLQTTKAQSFLQRCNGEAGYEMEQVTIYRCTSDCPLHKKVKCFVIKLDAPLHEEITVLQKCEFYKKDIPIKIGIPA